MRAAETRSLDQGFQILAQRASGPFRVAICREDPELPEITVRLDRLDDQSLVFQPLCTFGAAEWGIAKSLLQEIDQAIAEASRSLSMDARLRNRKVA